MVARPSLVRGDASLPPTTCHATVCLESGIETRSCGWIQRLREDSRGTHAISRKSLGRASRRGTSPSKSTIEYGGLDFRAYAMLGSFLHLTIWRIPICNSKDSIPGFEANMTFPVRRYWCANLDMQVKKRPKVSARFPPGRDQAAKDLHRAHVPCSWLRGQVLRQPSS